MRYYSMGDGCQGVALSVTASQRHDVCPKRLKKIGVPTGIRTPVAAVKGRCPRPLDDGDPEKLVLPQPEARPWRRDLWWSQAGSNRRPPACHAGALPAELWPRKTNPELYSPRIGRASILSWIRQGTIGLLAPRHHHRVATIVTACSLDLRQAA